MQESKRQKQVGALLLAELSDIFQRVGLSMIDGGLVSLTGVKLTPDLLEARVYLSLFQVKDKAAAMKTIEDRGWEIKRDLAARVKHQLRRIPTLQYFHDDTLEHADHMESIFRKIRDERGEEGGTKEGETKQPGTKKGETKEGGTKKGETKERGQRGEAGANEAPQGGDV